MRADHDQRNERHHSPRADRAYALSGRIAVGLLIAGIALLPTLVGGVARTPTASAAEATVNLGTAAPFSVLAGAGVTNTGPTILGGDLGTCPTPAITGSPEVVPPGETHANDAVACLAQNDLTIAYNSAAGRAPTGSPYPGAADLGGSTLLTGVYKTPESFAITGTLTLDAQLVPDAVFIFQAASTLITATNSRVLLINGAQACNVFWQVGSSATLGVASTFAGTVMALASITANTLATVDGRLLARGGAVTLDSNTVRAAACATSSSSSSTTDTTESDGSTSSTTDTTESSGGSSSTTDTTESGGGSSSTTDTTGSGGGSPGSGSDGGSPGGGSDGGSPEESDKGSSSTTTQPASTTTTAQGDSTSSTRSGDAINGATDTSGPATATDVLGGSVDGTGLNGPAPVTTLPRTGSPIAAAVLLAGLVLLLAGLALLLGVGGHPLRLATPRRRQQ